jgi:hypothetical protein
VGDVSLECGEDPQENTSQSFDLVVIHDVEQNDFLGINPEDEPPPQVEPNFVEGAAMKFTEPIVTVTVGLFLEFWQSEDDFNNPLTLVASKILPSL